MKRWCVAALKFREHDFPRIEELDELSDELWIDWLNSSALFAAVQKKDKTRVGFLHPFEQIREREPPNDRRLMERSSTAWSFSDI